MEKESANELERMESESGGGLGVRRPTTETDLLVVDGKDALVGQSDPMGVGGEIAENVLGSTEGRLAVDVPIDGLQLLAEGLPVVGMGEVREGSRQEELVVAKGPTESAQEVVFEEGREDADGEQESRTGGNPVLMLERETSGWDEAMDVGMVEEILSPGVEDGEKTDIGAQVKRIASQSLQGAGDGGEELGIEQTLVGKEDRTQRFGDCKDKVEVGDGEQIALTGGQPLLTTMTETLRTVPVATGLVRDVLMAATITLMEIAAQGAGSTKGQITQDFSLLQRSGMSALVSVPVSAKDLGHSGPRVDHDSDGVFRAEASKSLGPSPESGWMATCR